MKKIFCVMNLMKEKIFFVLYLYEEYNSKKNQIGKKNVISPNYDNRTLGTRRVPCPYIFRARFAYRIAFDLLRHPSCKI